jgi:YVTN family beta-propeller protein
VNPETLAVVNASPSAKGGPTALVVEYGWVWVAVASGKVLQFDPVTRAEVSDPTVDRGPRGIAAGADAIWVACQGADVVVRIAADLNFVSTRTIEVGDGPTAVAFGAGAVWVANSGDGTVSRIDPETLDVVQTIEVGSEPAGIAVFDGRVWVSVQAPFTP